MESKNFWATLKRRNIMGDIVVSCICVFTILMLIAAAWFAVCNDKTYDQRIKIIDYIYTEADYKEKSDIFHSVSYDKHLWFLFTFRDARKLYSKLYEVK